jgi:hypothetical protein
VQKIDHPKCQTGQSGFPESGQQFYSKELIRQVTQDPTTVKLRRSGLLSVGLSSDTLLLDRATNAWAMGVSADDVSAFPPWAGWYEPWSPPMVYFHPRWLGPTKGFVHGGYYTKDDLYRSVSHQQDRRALRQENWMVWNPKADGPVSLKTPTSLGQ